MKADEHVQEFNSAFIKSYQGNSGVGKTFFALEVAIAVAYGLPFLCFDAPKPSRVLYIDGEMPANAMQERLKKIIRRYNLNTNTSLPYIITPDLQNDFMPNLSTSSGQESIREHTDQADLIIVDNVSTLGGGIKENEAESWIPLQQWALGLRRQGKSVLFIHHAGKSGTQRGTSKREDILDTSIALKHPSDYEPSSGACFEIHFEKARSMTGESTNPICCWLTDDGWHYKLIEESNYLKVIELANQGFKQGDIAEELELSKGYICKLILSPKQGRHKLEKTGTFKLLPKLIWCQIIQRRMGSEIIVVLSPFFNFSFSIFQRKKPVAVETFITKTAIK